MTTAHRWADKLFLFALIFCGLTACFGTDRNAIPKGQLTAPGLDVRAQANNEGVDAVEVGHRLIAAKEYELAIRSFNRAALERGQLDAETLSGLGTANLQLGRLGQAEKQLKLAINQEGAQPVDFNNYAVLLMEQGKTNEAVRYFRRGFALSNGENIAIRDNLSLALAKLEKSATTETRKKSDYKLVRRGSSDFLIRPTP
ncbi:MAG: hypothetical protein ABJQ70_15350 [Roseobacter sp.]